MKKNIYSQDEIFLKFEGDNWFERNKEFLEQKLKNDVPLKLIELYNIKPKTVLEIGAANGFRLAEIHKRYGSQTIALEPSKKAIEDGKRKFPFIKFIRSTAEINPLDNEFVDFVIINFVFHWIDRRSLMRSIAEIDRVLKNLGFLLVGDFLPSGFLKAKYHHLPNKNVYTYKQNYAEIFLSTGLYTLIACLTGSHSSSLIITEENLNERIGFFLLQKLIYENYYESKINNK